MSFLFGPEDPNSFVLVLPKNHATICASEDLEACKDMYSEMATGHSPIKWFMSNNPIKNDKSVNRFDDYPFIDAYLVNGKKISASEIQHWLLENAKKRDSLIKKIKKTSNLDKVNKDSDQRGNSNQNADQDQIVDPAEDSSLDPIEESKDGKIPRKICPLCGSLLHFPINYEGTEILCPVTKRDPTRFKKALDKLMSTRSKLYAKQKAAKDKVQRRFIVLNDSAALKSWGSVNS